MSVAIIGAGPSGLALAKQLQDRNVEFVIFERDCGFGGVWNIANKHSVMYESAHTISSKTMTEFSEFPMPEEFSEYVSHKKMLQYLELYVEKFGLLKYIKFETPVKHIKKNGQGDYELTTYELTTEVGDKLTFKNVVVATGHVSKPNYPKLDTSKFSGQIIHAASYKNPSIFKNKRVLVVGAGNSGCDIACEAISTATEVALSIRRGYHFIPKFILGMPADVFGETSVKLRLPMRLRQVINQVILRVFQGNIQKLGFPKPDHRIFESHPIVNELLVYFVRHGDISIRKDISEIYATGVKYCDGSEMDVDIILFATGYVPDYGFLDEALVPITDELHLNLFSKKHAGLSFLGFVDPNGGVLGMLESQAMAVANSIAWDKSDELFALTQEDVALNGNIKYIKSARHRFEVDLATYRREINKLIKVLKK